MHRNHQEIPQMKPANFYFHWLKEKASLCRLEVFCRRGGRGRIKNLRKTFLIFVCCCKYLILWVSIEKFLSDKNLPPASNFFVCLFLADKTSAKHPPLLTYKALDLNFLWTYITSPLVKEGEGPLLKSYCVFLSVELQKKKKKAITYLLRFCDYYSYYIVEFSCYCCYLSEHFLRTSGPSAIHNLNLKTGRSKIVPKTNIAKIDQLPSTKATDPGSVQPG